MANVSFIKMENTSLVESNPKAIDLKKLKKQNGVIKKNSGASLIDIR